MPLWWMEPVCDQRHASSVAKGSTGASSFSRESSASFSAATAEAPSSPYARSLTSSR